MALLCPRCGREYDVTLFEYGHRIRCPCGELITHESGHRIEWEPDWESIERELFGPDELRRRRLDRQEMERIRRQADRITSLILYSDLPRVDVEIEIRAFKRSVLDTFPERAALFDALYIGRFKRLWSQFRDTEEGLFDGETPSD
ncbi:MAG: hypothetical protein JSV33_03910 [bacterium]|nr:MAG: hypothetical protein JSV33_03910 [bacterium]